MHILRFNRPLPARLDAAGVPLHLRRFKSESVHSHNGIKMHAVHSAIVRFDKSLFAQM